MKLTKNTNQGDFSKGTVNENIIAMALPMTVAQLVTLVYSMVDRLYIGHMPGNSEYALTGVGIVMPMVSIVAAFANLCTVGGTPLCSIARGENDTDKAETVMCNTLFLCISFGVLLTVIGLLFLKPILFMFGASIDTISYASDYARIYMLGNIFVIVSTGMCGFINCQGFGNAAMLAVAIGAVINLILDPLFIFALNMGVKGAAVATVISQACSAAWVMFFLTGKWCVLRFSLKKLVPVGRIIKEICTLGITGFIMRVTNGLIQIAANRMLLACGGDLYVGIMTVLSTTREMVLMVIRGINDAAKPVLGYNYGAKESKRVLEGIRFVTITCGVYGLLIWIVMEAFPGFFILLFNGNGTMLETGVRAMRLFFGAFFVSSFLMAGQTVFTALKKSKHAIFFSLLRKVVIVIPLTIILPTAAGLGTDGVFLAEPISELVCGVLCYATMYVTVCRPLKKTAANSDNQ